MWLMRTRLTWPLSTQTVAFSCTRIGQLRGGRDHATALHGSAVIAARLANEQQGDAYLRQMVCSASATLDATDRNDTGRQAA
jgi:chromosomal replication initiation ATPase DnaA